MLDCGDGLNKKESQLRSLINTKNGKAITKDLFFNRVVTSINV